MKQRIGIDYDTLFHALPGNFLVLTVDAPNFTIVDVNDSLADLVLLERSAMLNKPLKVVFPLSKNTNSRQGSRSLLTAIDQCVSSATPQSVGVIRYDIRDVNGRFIRRLWKTMLIPIVYDGSVTGIILDTQDVTEQFDNESYTQQRVAHLEHLLAVNETRDEFISVASHQLRTPATAVKQYLQMVLSGMFGEVPDVQRQFLERANESNERQLRIVSDLLRVAQVDSGKIELQKKPVDINKLVHDTVNDQMDMFKERNQLLELNIPHRPVVLTIDPDNIRMVIENIVDNASKYTEEGKRIAISVKNKRKVVRVIIQDEGVGVAKNWRANLFQKFQRIDNSLSTKVGGTGLGLYWAKKSVELHNGNILYEPARPRGSIFTIELPKM